MCDDCQYFDKVHFQIRIEIKVSTKENFVYRKKKKMGKLCDGLLVTQTFPKL